MPGWIDAHCHLADARFAGDLDAVVERARAAGVYAWVQGGVGSEDWRRQIELARRWPGRLVPICGVHPWRAAELDGDGLRAELAELERALPSAAGVGELGLDTAGGRNAPEKLDRQRAAFEAQLRLAREADKPLVLHVVRAHEPALELLERHGPFPRGGLVHGFSGDAATARRYLALGFLISVVAAAARQGRSALKQTLPGLPAQRLVLETDSPDGAGSSRNEPARLPAVARAAAELRGEEPEELLDRSARTLRELWGIAG